MSQALTELSQGPLWEDLEGVIIRCYEETQEESIPDSSLRAKKVMELCSWFREVETDRVPMVSHAWIRLFLDEYEDLFPFGQSDDEMSNEETTTLYMELMDDSISMRELRERSQELEELLAKTPYSPYSAMSTVLDLLVMSEKPVDRLDLFIRRLMTRLYKVYKKETGQYDALMDEFTEAIEARYDRLWMKAEDFADSLLYITSANGIESTEHLSKLIIQSPEYFHNVVDDLVCGRIDRASNKFSLKNAEKNNYYGIFADTRLRELNYILLGLYDTEFKEFEEFVLRRGDLYGIINYVALVMTDRIPICYTSGNYEQRGYLSLSDDGELDGGLTPPRAAYTLYRRVINASLKNSAKSGRAY